MSQETQSLNVTYIGNSLTNDARVRDTFLESRSQQDYSAALGQELNSTFHIACSQSLTTIVGDPSFTCVPDSTRWDQGAITEDTDVLTLQPHSRAGTTFQTEVDSALLLIDQAVALNSDVRVVIYSTWDRTDAAGGDFTEAWNRQVAGGDTSFVRSRAGFEYIHDELERLRPDVEISLVSVGDGFEIIDQAIKANGDFAGLTDVDQLYRDPIHLGRGQLLASAALWAEVTGNDPLELSNISSFGFNELDLALLSVASTITTPIPEPGVAVTLTLLATVLTVRRRSVQTQAV